MWATLLLLVPVGAFQPALLGQTRHAMMPLVSFKTGTGDNNRAEYLEKARRSVEGTEDFTLEEMEEIRANLHHERVLDLAAHGSDNLEYHMLEAELESQMKALESFTPESTIFHLHEDQERVQFDGSAMDVPRAADLLSFEETMASENLLEPIAMCLAVAAFTFLPQFLHSQ